MATPPTFSVGAVLTAAQMNAVGLWLVKTQTVGTGVSSVTVADAFTSDFDAYRIIYTGGTLSAAADMTFYFGNAPAANGYYESQTFVRYDTGATGVSTVNNQGQWTFVGGGDTNGCFIQVDLYNPFNSGVRKFMTFSGLSATVFTVMGTGVSTNTSSYTSFTLDPNGAPTMTGGTIRVYGFRK